MPARLAEYLTAVRRRLGTAADRGDADLLARVAARPDDEAFAALVARHGPAVLGACRAALRSEHDAEDAFQVTFVVLARRAGAVRPGRPLAPWLLGVAARVCREVRRRDGRRRAREARYAPPRPDPMPTGGGCDAAAVHAAVDALPDKYRWPVVLCYFAGRTHEQAAAELGWPVGTVRTRLSRGRDALRRRLAAAGGAAVLSPVAAVSVPPRLAAAAAAAAWPRAGASPAAVPSPHVSSLVTGVMQAMVRSEFTSRVVFPALAAVAAASLAVGGAAARWRADPPAVPAAPRPAGEAKKDRGPVPAAAKPVASAPLDLGGYQCAVKNWKDAPVLAAVVRSPADWEAVHAATPVMGDDRPFGPDEGVFEDRQVLLVARVVDAGDGWERAVRVTGVSADGDALFVECVYSPPEAGATFTATAAAAVLVPRKEYKSVTFVEDGKVVATLKAGAVTNAEPDDE